ncbi:BTAD domain-containing putative transcriptional regulator [Kibdelosporangium persicum]|uniref:DNA-binding transcriptional activator of the SARP family n=1 Tax=Kibdelosporangium persicum TaxID=2698649 RepID=A0ABX2F973_9PSEU|nr:BTAD domain-containing putative transcriptional regulator [Kibdelosporangium persicum]NRN67911.1 DNA-binding transcriptional activator of the SARP family [Kibdelosporangium persicum]
MGLRNTVECRTFGELTVLVDGRAADLGRPKQRLLLAQLLCRANSVVPVKDLVETLWAAHPPRTAPKNLQVYISKLRRTFGDRLGFTARGYRLNLTPDECDLLRFEHLARGGRRLRRDGDADAAADLLGHAVALWRAPLAEFADEPGLTADLGRWHEIFLASLEDWAELAVESGDHQIVLDRLAEHVRPHVLRERLGGAWIRALAADGRVQEALAHYELIRQTLADELGVDPSPMLGSVHRELLNGEARPPNRPGRFAPGNQLPRALPDFVGRAAEADRATETLSGHKGHRVVVVHGPVGSGKSSFAVHVAHLLRANFPDGQLFLDLAEEDGTPKPASRVFEHLLGMIGLDCGAAQASARWRSWIAQRRLLLVLDNATHEDTVRAVLPGWGTSGVLVTGRSPLWGLESVLRIRLGALGEAESRELLGRVIGRSRVLADRDAVGRIIGSCEGRPLAIQIVASRLAALRHITLAEFADRLGDPARVLDELAVGGLAFRDRLDLFYRTMSDLQRAAYRRLADLPPPPFEHGQIIAALADLAASPDLLLESLLECDVLAAPDAEVTACYASYDMSALTYRHCRETAARHRVSHSGAAGSP